MFRETVFCRLTTGYNKYKQIKRQIDKINCKVYNSFLEHEVAKAVQSFCMKEKF